MASVGRMSEFNPNEEEIGAYLMRLKHFFKANDIKSENHVSILITVIGPKILAVLADLISPAEVDSKTYEQLTTVLKGHFAPKKLVVAERYVFYSRSQKPGESIADFVVVIKHLASSCEFSSFLKDALRDKLISGISNENIRQKLLSEESNFDTTYALALRLEQAEKQANLFGQPHGEISKINVRGRGKSYFQGSNSTSHVNTKNSQGNVGQNKCWRCGSGQHHPTACSYASFKCHQCKRVGHLQKMCKSKSNVGQPFGRRNGPKFKVGLHQVESQEVGLGLVEDRPVEEVGLYN